jgi:hypothetical protein
MASEIFVNVTAGETRVALVENGLIVELYVERERDRSIVGNIYNGRVLRVLPGMQAAFVDIGLEKAASLYVSDIYEEMDEYDVSGRRPMTTRRRAGVQRRRLGRLRDPGLAEGRAGDPCRWPRSDRHEGRPDHLYVSLPAATSSSCPT